MTDQLHQHGPDCEAAHGHHHIRRPPRSMSPVPWPAESYPGWDLDPDPLSVDKEPPADAPPPIPIRWAWIGLAICLATIIAVALLLLAAPRSTAVIPPPGTSESPPSAGASSATPESSGQRSTGAPLGVRAGLGGAPQLRTTAQPSGSTPSQFLTATDVSGFEGGWATWCAPTADRCHGWAPPAMVGGTASFTFGDEPYLVQVRRADDPETSTIVWVVSHCGCGIRGEHRTAIDLSPSAFDDLAPLGDGLVLVEVEDLRGADLSGMELPPHPDDERMRLEDRELPATDTAP